MKCPNCGRESNGRFCPSCGASLRAAECAECGSKLAPGARFCTNCGAEAGAGAGAGAPAGGRARARKGRATATPDSGNLPWYIAGAVLLVIVLVLLVPMLMGGRSDVPAPGAAPFGAAQGAGAGTPPPLNGTPREQADRLFNRIMTARESGDTTNARFFAPMGIQAYQAAEPLDDDGLYHLATIHNVAGDYASARQVADRILARSPNHLLGLAAGAEAAEGAGDQPAAREYHRRLVEAYPTEIGRPLPEYQDHARILPEHLEISRRALR